jgi:hypothetical protein
LHGSNVSCFDKKKATWYTDDNIIKRVIPIYF